MVTPEFQCCYCAKGLARTDIGAIRFVLSGLWADAGGAAQEVFAHSRCAVDKFESALDASVPLNVEALAPD